MIDCWRWRARSIFRFSNYNANFNERITSSLLASTLLEQGASLRVLWTMGGRQAGGLGETVPDLPGCTAAASTTDEVLLRTVDALSLWVDALADGANYLVAGLVGIEGGAVSGLMNLASPCVGAPGRRPRHDERSYLFAAISA
jgi:hypothetical protein